MAVTDIDEQIIQLCSREVDVDKGFDLLMKTYGQRLYQSIRRMVVGAQDAEDVLQETLINAFRAIGDFRRESRLYTWLYAIATRECLRFYRQKKLVLKGFDDEGQWLARTLYAENDLKAETILLKFHEAILLLPEKQRLVFNMRYFDELSYEEISGITGSSVSSLKTNYHYAFERIKKQLRHAV
ncbi:RNA polymerase sigma factor [Taibaiella koreensis]|uniref:RNA polymerase sigma factor n=1 Tax=Taibaiella koreensis TaxID=1268548 RepID=UPI000E59F5F9|nr:sigma-70 family RNA polymerase sigma factor [Taibaiella koreensis]